MTRPKPITHAFENAFEIVEEDIEHVLCAYGTTISAFEDFNMTVDLDHDRIVKAVLYYTDFDDQVDCMHSEIEDQLIEESLVEGPKKFNCP